MHIPTLVAFSAYAATVSCLPHDWETHPGYASPPSGHAPSKCLTHADASYLVNNFIDHVATNYNATWGNRLIADNATVTSQSVNALMGKNGAALQGPTSVGKTAVLAAEQNKAFSLDIKLIKIDAVGCDSIAFRWWGTPADAVPVRAISIFNTVRSAEHGWQIKDIHGEFNSLTWGEDIGVKVTLPPPPPAS